MRPEKAKIIDTKEIERMAEEYVSQYETGKVTEDMHRRVFEHVMEAVYPSTTEGVTKSGEKFTSPDIWVHLSSFDEIRKQKEMSSNEVAETERKARVIEEIKAFEAEHGLNVDDVANVNSQALKELTKQMAAEMAEKRKAEKEAAETAAIEAKKADVH